MMKVARLARDHDQDLRTLAQLNATIYEQYTNPSPELVEGICIPCINLNMEFTVAYRNLCQKCVPRQISAN